VTLYKDPWGFSKLDTFRACPAKFKYQYIDKVKADTSSPAMERGGKIHESIEAYINGWTPHLHASAEGWKEAFDKLKLEGDFHGEEALGFDKQWNKLPDWFSKATWLRVKMDGYYVKDDVMTVCDWKTGKYRQPSQDQIELYAIAGLSIRPAVKKVVAEFWFIDSGDVFRREYTVDELILLRKKYEEESEQLYVETKWDPAPSVGCRYCPYSKTKSGPCKF
jgi:hypothetical protein